MPMSDLGQKLVEAGFEADEQLRDGLMEYASAANMTANGPYVIHECFSKGDVTVTIEQNTAPEDVGGLDATIQHPPCAIVEGPKGRVAANPQDADLVLTLVNELA